MAAAVSGVVGGRLWRGGGGLQGVHPSPVLYAWRTSDGGRLLVYVTSRHPRSEVTSICLRTLGWGERDLLHDTSLWVCASRALWTHSTGWSFKDRRQRPRLNELKLLPPKMRQAEISDVHGCRLLFTVTKAVLRVYCVHQLIILNRPAAPCIDLQRHGPACSALYKDQNKLRGMMEESELEEYLNKTYSPADITNIVS